MGRGRGLAGSPKAFPPPSPGEKGLQQALGPPLPTEETLYEAGIRVQIHSQEEPPIIDQLGFGAAPGYQTFVSCQQQQVSSPGPPDAPPPPRLPAPPSACAISHPNSQLCRLSRGPPSPGGVTTHILPGCPVLPERAFLTSPSAAELPATSLGRLQLIISGS